MLSRRFEVWMYSLHLPRSLLKRYAQHINQFGILSHCYVFSPLSPTKTLRSTYNTTWHHEPCLRCLFLPLEIITLNIWTKWNVIILILYSLIPSPTASQYVEHVRNIGILSHFWNLSPSTLQSNRFSIWVIVIDLTWFNPFDLTKQYVQQNMWGKLLKFPAHPPYKPIRSTHEQRSETGASKRTKISCGSRSGVVRGRQGSSGVVRGRQGSSGVVRGRQGSSGVVRVVRSRQLKLDNCCCHLWLAVFSFSKGLPLQIRSSSGLDVLSFSTDKRRQIRSKISFKGVVPNNVCVWTAVICCDSVLQRRHVSESLIQLGAPVGEQNYA